MSKFYNAFGKLITTNPKIEKFSNQEEEVELDELEFELEKNNSANKKSSGILNEIKSFKKQLEEGTITKEQVMKKMDKYNDLYRLKKLSKAEEKALRELEKTTISKVNGIGLRGNLELGGIIRAKGFYLQDGSKVNEVIVKKKILAVPIDKIGNISLRPKKEGKVNIESNIDIASEKRTGDLPRKRPSLYVTGRSGPGDFGQDTIAEFRHTNQSEGIGIGFNTIYAAGNKSNQDINFKPKGTGDIKLHGRTKLGENYKNPGELFIGNPKNSNNPKGWQTHFNYNNSGMNYIRGNTEVRGNLNQLEGEVTIANPKNGNNPSGASTHFNHKKQGLNYIRGKTEINGEVNFVNKGKSINISNGKHAKFNREGHATHFNYAGQGRNYIRGQTEIKGEVNFVDKGKGINIHNPRGGGTHFNYQGKGLNYIRGQTEIRGPELNVVSGRGVRVYGHGRVNTYGSLNSGWCHLITNAPNGFYMNKTLQVNGPIRGYNNKPINADKGINIGGIILKNVGGRLHINAPVVIEHNRGDHSALQIRRNGGDNSKWNYISFRDKSGRRTAWAGSSSRGGFGSGR